MGWACFSLHPLFLFEEKVTPPLNRKSNFINTAGARLSLFFKDKVTPPLNRKASGSAFPFLFEEKVTPPLNRKSSFITLFFFQR